MTRECVADQLGVTSDELPSLHCKISVFHSAVVTFLAPSDPSGLHGMWRERIHSTPLWRSREPRHDCAFIVEDETKEGMMGLAIVRVNLLFSFVHEEVYYPCALVDWFKKERWDPVTRMWVVKPDTTRGR